MEFQTAAKTMRVALKQYQFVHDGHAYIVTFTAAAGHEAKYAATFEKIAQSFRFTK